MNTAQALDHVGIAGADLGRLSAAYERLGFALTPIARHSGRRTLEGPTVPFGTGNRCAMLRQGYLELIAIVDPDTFTNSLEFSLARYAGLHILALGIDDEASNLARMRAAGVAIPGIAYLERPVDDADPKGPKARFARLLLPDAPEGRIFLIRHLTPEAIWQERFLSHPNHALGLAEVFLASAAPAETAARFSVLSGLAVTHDPASGFVLALPRGYVRILSPEALPAALPGVQIPALPFIAGITITTDDGNAAIRALLAERAVAHRTVLGGILVDAGAAGGAALLFRPA
ncbi:MAG: VOC family protein [Rhodospirillales bacterium]|nr:VOC family protein [Rhodospirillales bacterium]